MKRSQYLDHLEKLALPVLTAAANDQLKTAMTVDEMPGANRADYAVLEAVARLLCGIAPWLDAEIADESERMRRNVIRGLSQQAVIHLADPHSADYGGFSTLNTPYSQILVDTAFLAQAILRAPKALWADLPAQTQQQLVAAFLETRKIKPHLSNWLLFSAEIEALLRQATGKYDHSAVFEAVRMMDSWYCGDGFYSDGPMFAYDYYNSIVIHPMLLDLSNVFRHEMASDLYETLRRRATRYAQVQERMIAADGTYIVHGRSVAYRGGVFHLLSAAALEGLLPASLPPAGVRSALGAVLQNTLKPSSYREDGFLRIGICGEQKRLGESYICTGSLYLASAPFLPLGLPANNAFWLDKAVPWTQKRIWSGEDVLADHAVN